MSDSPETPSQIKFTYLKSNYFRVVHTDGAIGGFTPQGNIFVSIYSERAPLPDVTVQAVEGGKIGQEIIEERKGTKEGVIRELEVGFTMNVSVAKSLLEWLKQRIEIAEQLQADPKIQESVKQ
jgi:hypothetical protein